MKEVKTMKVFINYALIKELRDAEKRQLVESVSQLVDLGMPHKEALTLVANMSQDLADNWHGLKGYCFERKHGSFNESCHLPSFDWYRIL